jgi:hypothetical protein
MDLQRSDLSPIPPMPQRQPHDSLLARAFQQADIEATSHLETIARYFAKTLLLLAYHHGVQAVLSTTAQWRYPEQWDIFEEFLPGLDLPMTICCLLNISEKSIR